MISATLRAPLRGDHAVVVLARQQAEREADDAGGVRQHPLDGQMRLAGVRRAEHSFDPRGESGHAQSLGCALPDCKLGFVKSAHLAIESYASPAHMPRAEEVRLMSEGETIEGGAPVEEQHDFSAEVGRLLDLVVHSLYSEREIFLRELVANAADAIDRRRFEALTDPSAGPAGRRQGPHRPGQAGPHA